LTKVRHDVPPEPLVVCRSRTRTVPIVDSTAVDCGGSTVSITKVVISSESSIKYGKENDASRTGTASRRRTLTRFITSFLTHKEGTMRGAMLGHRCVVLLLLFACLRNVLTRSSTRGHQRDYSRFFFYLLRCCVLLMA
jgi:hypothetical protein